MSYNAALLELRQMLADTPQHKRATRKKLLGQVDGNNVSFVSYDKRIVDGTFQAYVNDGPVSANVTDLVAGEIEFAAAPDQNSKVTASYYWQWWLDSELITFLNKGAELTGQFNNNIPDKAYLQIEPGLKNAALQFALSVAADSLANYLLTRKHSGEFLLEQDKGTDEGMADVIRAMTDMSSKAYKKAMDLRDDFYKRQGRRNKPSFGYKLPITKKYGPNR